MRIMQMDVMLHGQHSLRSWKFCPLRLKIIGPDSKSCIDLHIVGWRPQNLVEYDRSFDAFNILSHSYARGSIVTCMDCAPLSASM